MKIIYLTTFNLKFLHAWKWSFQYKSYENENYHYKISYLIKIHSFRYFFDRKTDIYKRKKKIHFEKLNLAKKKYKPHKSCVPGDLICIIIHVFSI